MKVAIYNPYLDTLGGGERYTLSFALVLAKEGYQVDIEWPEKDILKKLSKRFSIGLHKNITVVNNIKKGDGYDICFWISDGGIPLLRAKRNFLHFQVPFKNVGGNGLFNKIKLFKIEKVICNSNFTKRVIDREYSVKSIVIYPSVGVLKIKPKRKENLILYVGRFSNLAQNKGQHHLIVAFRKLVKNDRFKDWKLVLAGGAEIGVGDFIKKLKKESRGLNIDILQSPEYDTLRNLYGKAKIFWSAAGYGVDEEKHPEKVEHFGISLVEAMAGGVVPIVCNVGGYKEIVQEGINGFLWSKKEDLVKISTMIVKDKKRMEQVSTESVKKANKFSYLAFKKNVKMFFS